MPKLTLDILKDVEMDDEFKEVVERYTEKELTPLEMDLKVRMDRVIYILNKTLATIKVMVFLPTLLENEAELLTKFLQPQEVFFVLHLINTFGGNFNLDHFLHKSYSLYSNILDNITVNRMPKTKKSCELQPNPQICHMINILFDNKCIRKLIKDAESATVNVHMVEFMNVMEDLKKVAKDKITETGEEEVAKNKELRQAYKHNNLVIAGINELTARLQKQRAELGEQLNKKVKVFSMYNNRIENIKTEFKAQLEALLTTSEKEMMNRSVISEENQITLAEDAKKITKQYELLLEDHLVTEKISRSKRFKTETQLQNWLIKYDQDIGERQTEFEALQKKYDDEKEEMEALEELFEEQEVEYDRLMKEKAEEEERIYNEMAFHLLQSRSARIIQRAWRAFIQRKKARRRGKKGKGKGGKTGKAKTKKEKTPSVEFASEDPNIELLKKNKKYNAEVFDEINNPHAFDKKDVVVEL